MNKETVIEGVVTRADAPVPGAYVRLLDASGEFTAEVQTSATGEYRFFAAPGDWTLRALAGGGMSGEAAVTADVGVNVADVVIASV